MQSENSLEILIWVVLKNSDEISDISWELLALINYAHPTKQKRINLVNLEDSRLIFRNFVHRQEPVIEVQLLIYVASSLKELVRYLQIPRREFFISSASSDICDSISHHFCDWKSFPEMLTVARSTQCVEEGQNLSDKSPSEPRLEEKPYLIIKNNWKH